MAAFGIFWYYVLPPSYHPYVIGLTIRCTHTILALQYELSELASTGVGSTDHHPVLSATGGIIQGDGPRTASRMKACNKGKADLASCRHLLKSKASQTASFQLSTKASPLPWQLEPLLCPLQAQLTF